ncbi:MAG: UDP-N-acetylmuramoyl-L-alanine--D-glutamate ligase [bacterium]
MDQVCLSPGLALAEPVVQAAIARGLPVLGDMELFAWQLHASARARVAAITGTNGKTTVTALVGHLLRSAGIDCEVAGNIGPAALAALMRRAATDVATVLNLSQDHLDRYASLEEYGAAKARIFAGAALAIVNRDDVRARALAAGAARRLCFGLDTPPRDEDYGILVRDGTSWLARGRDPILEAGALGTHGRHNLANALAAAALAQALGIDAAAIARGLATFEGLPHRLQRVALRRGVAWYDDSKGTNVGATVAALRGLETAGRVLLIAGGDGKGQDFAPLATAVIERARCVLLIGRDAPRIDAALAPSGVPLERCATLENAVARAAAQAEPGDAVLLSPACASFDMFRDYRERGDVFTRAVRALGA